MILLLDIGATNTRIARAEREGDMGEPVLFPTALDFLDGIKNIEGHATAVLAGEKPEAIVVGITGAVSMDGALLKSPNLPAWEGQDLKQKLSDSLGAPTHILNDAVLGALGEATNGAGKGARTVLYMTLGTGIGFARVIDGSPDFSIGSESGHQYIDIDGEHLVEAEDLVSGRAVRARLGMGGEEVHDAEVWSEYARLAAIPLYNSILAYAPDRVVVGGSLVKEGSLSIPALKAEVEKIATHLPKVPDIVPASLGDACGLYGGQAYANSF